jgi:hypothetical protein
MAGILKGWYDHVRQSNRSQRKPGESSEVLNRKVLENELARG